MKKTYVVGVVICIWLAFGPGVWGSGEGGGWEMPRDPEVIFALPPLGATAPLSSGLDDGLMMEMKALMREHAEAQVQGLEQLVLHALIDHRKDLDEGTFVGLLRTLGIEDNKISEIVGGTNSVYAAGPKLNLKAIRDDLFLRAHTNLLAPVNLGLLAVLGYMCGAGWVEELEILASEDKVRLGRGCPLGMVLRGKNGQTLFDVGASERWGLCVVKGSKVGEEKRQRGAWYLQKLSQSAFNVLQGMGVRKLNYVVASTEEIESVRVNALWIGKGADYDALCDELALRAYAVAKRTVAREVAYDPLIAELLYVLGLFDEQKVFCERGAERGLREMAFRLLNDCPYLVLALPQVFADHERAREALKCAYGYDQSAIWNLVQNSYDARPAAIKDGPVRDTALFAILMILKEDKLLLMEVLSWSLLNDQNALHRAAGFGDEAALGLMLNVLPNGESTWKLLTSKDMWCQSILHLAAQSCSEKGVGHLLQALQKHAPTPEAYFEFLKKEDQDYYANYDDGVDRGDDDRKHYVVQNFKTALHVAARKGKGDVVMILMDSIPSAEKRREYAAMRTEIGTTAARFAEMRGFGKLAEVLREYEATGEATAGAFEIVKMVEEAVL